MLKNLLKLLFPDLCYGCKQLLLRNETILCVNCRHEIPYTYHHKIKDNDTTKKFYGLINIEFGISMLYFHKNGITQNLIHNLKYRGHQEIGAFLGNLYAAELSSFEEMKTISAIIPVPLHPKRLKKRGYNQIDTFCIALSEKLEIPYNCSLLERKKYTQTQTKKNKLQRQKIVSDTFAVRFSEKDHGQHFLLVDDVITTGATIEVCAKALLKIPNSKVSILTIANTHS